MVAKQLWREELESVFQGDLFDLEDWQKVCGVIDGLEDSNVAASQEYTGQPVQDAFLSLLKLAPQLNDPQAKKLVPLADILGRGMNLPEYKNLRENTIGQPYAAAFGAQHFIQTVLKNLPDDVKKNAREQAKQQDKADNANAQAEALQNLMSMLQEQAAQLQQRADNLGLEAQEMNQLGDPEEADNLQEQADQAQAKADQLNNQAQQAQTAAQAAAAQAAQAEANAQVAADAYEAATEANGSQIANVLNQAAAAASGEAQEANSLIKSFSLAAGGDPSHVDPETAKMAMEVMKRNPHLKNLAELIGWAKRMVKGEWRKSIKGSDKMTGYGPQELQPARMASFERMAMVSSDPARKAGFVKRVVENSVTHQKFEGDEKQGKGPMVIIRDESGSMSGHEHATAVALEWALMEIAKADKREFYSIPFSGTGQFNVWKAPAKGDNDSAGLMAHLSHFYGGGTEPYGPINRALDVIAKNDLKADILVLTDGSFSQPSQDFLTRIKEIEPKIVTVTIGGWGDAVAKSFSNKTVNVTDLFTDKENLREAVAEIV